MAVPSPSFHIFLLVFLFLLVLLHPSSCQNADNNTKSSCQGTKNIQCKDGVMLPAWMTPGNNSGSGWMMVKAFVYLVTMFILFIGISIISDTFMASIEVITSNEKQITIQDSNTGKKQVVMVKIWNETVANLSLMALGSSAPEILLSVIEIIGRGFKAGELGPSTIVGSAAFNLFMITAVCVSVLPDGETRKIKQLPVFAFTASCSVFAYVWMYLILAVFSPGVIHLSEGVLTFLFFPTMIGVSWCIDTRTNPYRALRRKYHTMVRQSESNNDNKTSNNQRNDKGMMDLEKDGDDGTIASEQVELFAYTEGDDIDTEVREKKRQLVEAYHRVKEKYPNVDANTMQQLVQEEHRQRQPKSRAFYRIQAVRTLTGQGSVLKNNEHEILQRIEESTKERGDEQEEGVYFSPCDYTCVESCGMCYITVVRHGNSTHETVEVDYETMDGSATANDDYFETKGTLVFAPGEQSKNIGIKINDDDVFELDEHFYCKLTMARCTSEEMAVRIGEAHTAKVTILDDDYPGVFTLENDRYQIMESIGVLTVRVLRKLGARGKVRIPWHTEERTALGYGEDFDDAKGELEFDNEEFVKNIDVVIYDREEYEKDKVFQIVLGEPILVQAIESGAVSETLAPISSENDRLSKIIQAGMAALGDNKECEVQIVECQEFRQTIDAMLMKKRMTGYWKSSSWYEQFTRAFTVEAGDDENDDDDNGDEENVPSYYDYFSHYLSLVWKVLFAFVPPVDIMNGWACFCVAIAMIGLLTAVTGDVASHFGCTIGLADSVVAITFVALGTSLPDTFASKVATIHDETADASIGNVTGSNSVNVFLGIGLAWSVAAFYHTANGNEFRVETGTLGFSVMVFCIEALFCIGFLMFRRFYPAIGAELGGSKRWCYITSCVMASLWFIYILTSSLQAYCHIHAGF